MRLKTRIMWKILPFWWMIHRSKVLGKKVQKFNDEKRYSMQWRCDYVLKKSRKILKLFRIELVVKGYEHVANLSTGIITSNHSSLLDPNLIICALAKPQKSQEDVNPRFVFLAKKELIDNKWVKGFAKVINTYFIDRENPRESVKVTEEVVEHAKKHKKLIVIFPEGTRSTDGTIGEFKAGVFSIAKRNFLPIVPVTINNALSITDFSRRAKLKIEVIFHPPLKPGSLMDVDSQAIANNVRKKVQSAWVKPEGSRSIEESKYA